jgi:hypothetical protein
LGHDGFGQQLYAEIAVASSLTGILGGPPVEGKRSRLKCGLAKLLRISKNNPRRWPGVTLACEA